MFNLTTMIQSLGQLCPCVTPAPLTSTLTCMCGLEGLDACEKEREGFDLHNCWDCHSAWGRRVRASVRPSSCSYLTGSSIPVLIHWSSTLLSLQRVTLVHQLCLITDVEPHSPLFHSSSKWYPKRVGKKRVCGRYCI